MRSNPPAGIPPGCGIISPPSSGGIASLNHWNPEFSSCHLPALCIELILLGIPALVLANGLIDKLWKG
jgi:hypothetical protein